MASPVNNPKPTSSVQSKLTLQDMRAVQGASTATLRITADMVPGAYSALDATAAQETWQALQLTPEAVADKIAQLRTANVANQAAAKQLQLLQTEATGLRQIAQEYRSNKWQQPALYAAGAALVGASWLWLSERKKRIHAQEHISLLQSEAHSVLAMPEGPSLNFAESEAGAPADPAPKAAAIKSQILDPIAESISPEDLLPYLAPKNATANAPAEPISTKPLSKQAWWKPKKSKPLLTVNSAAGLNSQKLQAHLSSNAPVSEIDAYDELALMEEMQASLQESHNPDFANVESLTQTRVKPVSSDDAMGHLLEIRMAVEALCALNQQFSAQRLLHQHIEAVPTTCAWAYIEYLNLCLQLGQRDEFEAMRKRYRMQFNRLAPYWMEPNASVQPLESYDRPIAELCAVWPSPEKAKAMIANWLLGSLNSRRLFQLPAYHDLLDLYEMFEFYEGASDASSEFTPTVNLLDLDYEFAVDVKLDAQSSQDTVRAIPAVKTGGFDVDFNVTQIPVRPVGLMDILEPAVAPVARKSP